MLRRPLVLICTLTLTVAVPSVPRLSDNVTILTFDVSAAFAKGNGGGGGSGGGGGAGKGGGGDGGGNAGGGGNGAGKGGGGNSGGGGSGAGAGKGGGAGAGAGKGAGKGGGSAAGHGMGRGGGKGRGPVGSASAKAGSPASAAPRRSNTPPAPRPNPRKTTPAVAVRTPAVMASTLPSPVSSPALSPFAAVSQVANRPVAGHQHSAGEIVASGLTEPDLQRLGERGFSIQAGTKGRIGPKIVRLRVPQGQSLEQARYAVREINGAATTELDYFYFLDGPPSCSGAGCDTRQTIGWTATGAATCGTSTRIGMIDTRIDLQDGALTGGAIEIVVARKDGTNSADTSHGTAVAALLVGQGVVPGLLPKARLVAADAFYREREDKRDKTDVVTLVRAMELLAERRVQVINLSLSGPASPILRQAVEAALAAEIVLVAAVGNEGPHAPPSYPAAYDGVIAVTAIDREGNVYPRANQGAYIDLAAPGVDLVLAGSGNERRLRSGSSYAAPFVTAAVAQLRGLAPELSPAIVRSVLAMQSLDLGAPGRDPVFGAGLLQIEALCSFASPGTGEMNAPAPFSQRQHHAAEVPDATASGRGQEE